MSAVKLSRLLCMHPFNDDATLTELVLNADQDRDGVLYIGNIIGRTVAYISPFCQTKLGYPASRFTKGGPAFFYQITDEKYLPSIVNLQVTYVKQLKSPGFDPRQIIIQKFLTALVHPQHGSQEFVCLGVVLTLNKLADPEHFIGFIVEPDEPSVFKFTSLLKEIKTRHNDIYIHPQFAQGESGLPLVYATNGRQDETVTRREIEVLQLLSKGFSTKEIADQLDISFHTTEGYRKNLLQKFNARNSAELIKNASKVFWLE